MKKNRSLGFTLVELSVVLIIIGLIAAGIMEGVSLVRNAKILGVITDKDKYFAAISTFEEKYSALPGDMYDAYDFWGTASSGNCTNNTVPAATGCNGNGNGFIETNEEYRAWQHLSLAGLIVDDMSGTHTSDQSVIGTNIPASEVIGAGWLMQGAAAFDMGWDSTDGAGINHLFFGTISGDYPYGAALTVSEAYGIDDKLDDGAPGTGAVRHGADSGLFNMGCLTSGSTDEDTSVYVLSTTNEECHMVFLYRFR